MAREGGNIPLPEDTGFLVSVSGSPIKITHLPNSDQRPLYTFGLSDCRAVATYTPNRERTLCHVNGGLFQVPYDYDTLASHVHSDTSVLFIMGGNGTRGIFEDDAQTFRVELNAALVRRGEHYRASVTDCWATGRDATAFYILHDGTYGRCGMAASVGSGSGGGCCKCTVM